MRLGGSPQRSFSQWLAHEFWTARASAAGSEAIRSALAVIESKARFEGPELEVYVRVGEAQGKIYIDLCDPDWNAVEVDAEGWRVVKSPPVRFRRAPGMLPLPIPAEGGSIEALRTFLNVQSESDFVLIVAFMLAALKPSGPYPILAVAGEQGTAKSTLCKILRSLVDPNSVPLRRVPHDEADLFIAARNGHLLAFDNISGLPPSISDTMCQLSTGGGYTKRMLYTDGDEALFNDSRPQILNGITDVVTRADLADRTIFISLEPIPDESRREEREVIAAFERVRPGIFGALLTAVSTGIAKLPETQLKRLPRQADFARWGSACETAIWPAGTFMAAYESNQGGSVQKMIDADPVSTVVRQMMAEIAAKAAQEAKKLAAMTPEERAADIAAKAKREAATLAAMTPEERAEIAAKAKGEAAKLAAMTPEERAAGKWEGSAAALLATLNGKASDAERRSRRWPPDATRASSSLRRAAPNLRKIGLEIEFPKPSGNKRDITIRCTPSFSPPAEEEAFF